MTRRIVVTILAALLVLAAGCVGAVQPTATAATASDGSDNTISVSATAGVSADPDLAVVRVAVVERAETAEAARERAATSAASMRQALSDLGIGDDAIRTTGYFLDAEYDTERGRELVGYRVTHAFEVEAAPDEAGAVIDAAVANGASRVDGVRFTLAEDTRRDLRQDALAAAMANARADADTVATAADVSIAGVQSVSTGDVSFVPFESRLERSADAGAGTVIESGPVTVSASVHVTYTIGT